MFWLITQRPSFSEPDGCGHFAGAVIAALEVRDCVISSHCPMFPKARTAPDGDQSWASVMGISRSIEQTIQNVRQNCSTISMHWKKLVGEPGNSTNGYKPLISHLIRSSEARRRPILVPWFRASVNSSMLIANSVCRPAQIWTEIMRSRVLLLFSDLLPSALSSSILSRPRFCCGWWRRGGRGRSGGR